MPRSYTLTDLIRRCQQRCNMEGDPAIAPDEWARLISEAYGELYTIVFESGLEYFERALAVTTTGAQTIGEPVDHLSTVQVAYLVDATARRYIALRELMAQERTIISGQTIASGNFARAFALVDRQIYLYPTPPAGQVYEIRYVPQPVEFTEPANLDVVTPDGLSFLVWNVVVMALAKVEIEPSVAMERLEAARDRFTQSVQLRALNAPRRRILDIETDVGDGEWADRMRW